MENKLILEVTNIKFSEVRYANDIFFSIQTGILAKKISAVDKEAYVATVRKDSLSFNFCSTSEEFKVRLGEAIKVDRYIKKSRLICTSRGKSEADELLWYIYYKKGERYLWKCFFDSIGNMKVFKVLLAFLLKRKVKNGFNSVWRKM